MIHADHSRSRAVRLARKRIKNNHRYGAAFKSMKASLRPYVAAGLAECVRCHLPIAPDEPWDLGHPDGISPGGPEHAKCNRGAPHRNVTSREW